MVCKSIEDLRILKQLLVNVSRLKDLKKIFRKSIAKGKG